ncbi:MAG TPA: hypothetical protein VK578_06895, partial [Edaphobacter sp.]|nr:hypothetical protein [Edaphobacter sp.]
GARQVECTINGIGERAGNAALEEIAAVLMVRRDKFPYTNNIVLSQLYATSQMLAECIAFGCSPNKAVVGANAFAHESGIHQHGMMANPLACEIMTPESVGAGHTKFVLGKHSGRRASLIVSKNSAIRSTASSSTKSTFASPNSPTATNPSTIRTCSTSCNPANQSPWQPSRSPKKAIILICGDLVTASGRSSGSNKASPIQRPFTGDSWPIPMARSMNSTRRQYPRVPGTTFHREHDWNTIRDTTPLMYLTRTGIHSRTSIKASVGTSHRR